MSKELSTIRDAVNKFLQEKKDKQLAKDRGSFVESVSAEVVKIFTPFLQEMATSARMSKEEIRAVAEDIALRINIPEINIPEIIMPKMPVISVPEIKVPKIEMPKEMDIKGWVGLQGVNLENPLPVQLRDAKGRPVNLLENLTTIVGGVGGAKITRIGGFGQSAYADYLNADGRLRVSVETASAGLTDTELRASSVPVAQASGASWSVEASQVNSWLVSQVSGANWSVEVATQPITFDVKQVSGSADSVNASQVGTWIVDQLSGASWSVSATKSGLWDIDQLSGANWSVSASQVGTWIVDQLSGASWSVAATKSGLWDVDQLSGATWSVYANNPSGQGDTATALRVVIAGDSAVSVTAGSSLLVDQLSGANWSVFATNPVAQGDAATALRVVIAGNSDASVTATQTGTWTVALSGSLASAVVTGPSAIGVADDGTAPVQIGGIGRTTNPTKVTDGQVVKSMHDAVGRQLVRPVQVRGLLQTAYLSLTTGTETTLLAGVAGVFMDLVYIMATNSSDAAVTVDLRSATGAGIQTSIRVPANATAGVSLAVPLPQDAAADTWTADMPDITGTTVTLGALFSREV